MLPKKYPEDLFISFHNHEPDNFLKGNFFKYHKLKYSFRRTIIPLIKSSHSFWGNDIVFSTNRHLKDTWVIEIPGYWDPREESPLLKYVKATKTTIRKYYRTHLYYRIGTVNIEKSKELGLYGKEMVETVVDGVRKIITKFS